MDNESIARLKFDRRLASRRNWVEPEELEQELASLPDAADKVFVPIEEPAEPEAEVGGAAPVSSAPATEGGTAGA